MPPGAARRGQDEPMTATAMAAHAPSPGSLREDDLLEEVFLFFDCLDAPDGYRAQLIEGEIIVTPPPDGHHVHCLSNIVRQVLLYSATRMDFSATTGLVLPRDGMFPRNHVVPDATFTPEERDVFKAAPPWMEPRGVALVVEVTGPRPDRDRREKRRSYAQGHIPLYVLVDREKRHVTLYSEPFGPDYEGSHSVSYGKPLPLPEPFAFDLDTAPFA